MLAGLVLAGEVATGKTWAEQRPVAETYKASGEKGGQLAGCTEGVGAERGERDHGGGWEQRVKLWCEQQHK